MTIVHAPPPPGKWKAGTASPLHMHLHRLGRELTSFAYRYATEVDLHERMAHVLQHGGYTFERERILSKENRADFFLPDSRIAIEVKVAGTLSEALRQVDRYVHLDDVAGVLLASTQRWADVETPDRLSWQEKPFHLVRLRRQTL